jgi:nitroreductase
MDLAQDHPSVVTSAELATMTLADKLRLAVGYAVLAPSSHNSQPWRFRIADTYIAVSADESKALPVADRDRRELYISLGCAIENLVIALHQLGIATDVTLFPLGETRPVVAWVTVAQTSDRSDAMPFSAITTRHTHRGAYDPTALTTRELLLLEDAVRTYDCDVAWLLEGEQRHQLEELTLRADALLFADPQWRDELAGFIRDGAFGQPRMMARLGSFVVSHFDLGRATARKDHALIVSAPALGILVGRDDRRASRVLAGRALERMWLTAEVLGLRVQPMNQALQIPELAEGVHAIAGRTPQIVFRVGHAEPAPQHTPRRDLADVLDKTSQ